MTAEPKTKPGFYGWVNVAILFFIYFSAFGGVFYSFSVIFPAMIKDLGWSRADASIAHTSCIFMMGLLTPVLAVLIKKIGMKKTIILGLSVSSIALVLLSTVTNNIYMWFVLWGLLIPIGFAFAGYIPIMTMIMMWFSVKRATVLGIVLTSSAISGFLAQPGFAWLMGKYESWQIAWAVCAGFTILALIASFFLVGSPSDVGQHPDGISPEEAAEAAKNTSGQTMTYRSPVDWPLKNVFKNPVIWFITIMNIGHIQGLMLVTSHGIMHFTDQGFSTMQAASVLSIIILSAGAARFPVGWLADRIEPQKIAFCAMFLMFFGLIGIWKAPSLGLCTAAGVVYGFCYGAVLVLGPLLSGNYFGPEAFPKISGVLGPPLTVFTAVVPVFAGFIVEKFGNYNIAFATVSAIILVGTICILFASPPKPDFIEETVAEV
ncbi:MAG: MFS transporter [Desulfobacterales bacterium]|jgi:sugar phosphate permease|nr:MFS transporter [Desulfobacteraceae bacterium]MBT7085780.1 MFS transporter [Desulfobacterales bacterium]